MPDNPWLPITWPFHYKPRWQGPLSGRDFEKQTEDALNYLYNAMEEGAATSPSDAIPKAPGTPTPGTSALYSRGDHVHPLQEDIPGNAASANKLKTARVIELTGDATGEAYFDGSGNVQIETTIPEATTSSDGLMSAEDKARLDNLSPANTATLDGDNTFTGYNLFERPLVANITGNAATASKLETARTIALIGDVTGSGNFDGSANIQIDTDIDAITDAQIEALFPGGGGGGSVPWVDLVTDQNVGGAKVFAEGPYGATRAVTGTEINLNYGCVFTKTISANTTFTLTGVPTGAAATFNLILTNGGSRTVTWPASVKWSSGNPPDLTASGSDVLTFMTPDGGSTWYGTVALAGAA